MNRLHPILYVIGLSLVALSCTSGTLRAEDHFQSEVAPILQRRCLSCHDDRERKGDFSLQSYEAAMVDGYIEAGDSASSHLVDLITPRDGSATMPKDSDPLAEKEIDAIRRWIDSGAGWPREFQLQQPRVDDLDWWSYRPVARPEIPPIEDAWIQTPIDAFILSRLRSTGLERSAEADRRTLIRRVTYDLIGLPPTPAQVDAFVRDPDPRAYENLVDRLLQSKHYGERWARHWLDVVKYADTCGYDKDKLRPNAWPYRDYVIRSLNDDKPYSQFVQEQIAGDVLFPGQPDGILGLGFIAAGPWDFIGHVEVPETKIDGQVARNLDRDDMVSGTLNTFCSVTIQCARCHNHKFDPITQEHYYGLQSLFAAVDRAERPYDLDPQIDLRRRELESKITARRAEIASVDKQISDAGGAGLQRLDEQIATLRAKVNVEKDAAFGYHSAMANRSSEVKWVEVDLGRSVNVAEIVLQPCHDDFGGIGAGFGFPVRFQVAVANQKQNQNSDRDSDRDSDDAQAWQIVSDESKQDLGNPGLEPYRVKLNAAKVRRVRVTATRLMERSGVFNFALAELRVIDSDGNDLAIGQPVSSLDSIEAPVRWRRSNLTDGKWARYSDPSAAEQLAESMRSRRKLLAEIETPERVRKRTSASLSMENLQAELASLPKGKMVYAAATHFKRQSNFIPTEGKLRPVQVLHRGEVQLPREPAKPGMIPLHAELDWQVDPEANESERRAALARWLTDSKHPLVWRSIVNRVWQYHFGRGIVATPNDFGRMGATPTHPDLLDWLATEFRDGGRWLQPQSLKSLHRLIVTSSVYRQSSSHNRSNAEIDGSNQYVWKMNRRRLEAEEIRDSILQVSGAMNTTMGGPAFYLFALEQTEHSPHYEYHKFDPNDANSHRRSIYRFIVRSQPDPWMTTLDCADSSQSTPKRNETLTSLQALSLLNSRFNLVMAEKFAERLERESSTSELREIVTRAVSLVTQRTPSPSEIVPLVDYAREHGLANLCRFLFNLSEFVYLD